MHDIVKNIAECFNHYHRAIVEIEFTDFNVWGPVEMIVNSLCEDVFSEYIRIYELEEETSWSGWNAVITTLVNVDTKEAIDIIRSVKDNIARMEIERRTARDYEIDYALRYTGE